MRPACSARVIMFSAILSFTLQEQRQQLLGWDTPLLQVRGGGGMLSGATS